MTNNINLQVGKAKIKAYVMIIDKNGNPVIDDPSTVPPEAWAKLTPEQKKYANAQVPLKMINLT